MATAATPGLWAITVGLEHDAHVLWVLQGVLAMVLSMSPVITTAATHTHCSVIFHIVVT